jgi:cell division protein FtsB
MGKIKEIKTENIEELQLLLDKSQSDNKKLLSEQTDLQLKIQFLSEQNDQLSKVNKELNEEVDDLSNILKKNATEFNKKINENEKLKLSKVIKEIKYKYKLRDSVFYLTKYQRMPFWVSRHEGSLNGEPVYRLVSDNGLIIENVVKESDIGYHTTKTLNQTTEFKVQE